MIAFLCVIFMICCVIGGFGLFIYMMGELHCNRFNFLVVVGIVGCLISFCSVPLYSTYLLEKNISDNHTYVVKGKIIYIMSESARVENTNYSVNPKYMIEPFLFSDLEEGDKIEIVVAESIFSNYIVKINSNEKAPKIIGDKK